MVVVGGRGRGGADGREGWVLIVTVVDGDGGWGGWLVRGGGDGNSGRW